MGRNEMHPRPLSLFILRRLKISAEGRGGGIHLGEGRRRMCSVEGNEMHPLPLSFFSSWGIRITGTWVRRMGRKR